MADGQYASPFIVNVEGDVIPLKRVSFAAGGDEFNYNEEWLQNLLFANPSSLPIKEIDSAYQNLVPICTELNTPAGPIDVFYATPDGQLVLLEAKLWRNPEARRKVIGQILDYAKELNGWDYEELQKQVSRRRSMPGNALYQLVQAKYPNTDESEFVDGVSRSLRTGRFMLLIVGDGIREGAGAIAQFLDNVGHLQFSLGLVEVGLYEMPEKGVLVQPRVLAKTVIINRTVIELSSPDIKIQPADETISQQEMEDTFCRDFWAELLDGLVLDDVTQRVPKPPKGPCLWFVLPPNGDNAWINAYFAGSAGEVGVYFRLGKNEFGEMAYALLEEQKDQILSELPKKTEWRKNTGGFNTVSISLPIRDVRDPSVRNIMKDFFSKNINAFVNAFRARMESIVEKLRED